MCTIARSYVEVSYRFAHGAPAPAGRDEVPISVFALARAGTRSFEVRVVVRVLDDSARFVNGGSLVEATLISLAGGFNDESDPNHDMKSSGLQRVSPRLIVVVRRRDASITKAPIRLKVSWASLGGVFDVQSDLPQLMNDVAKDFYVNFVEAAPEGVAGG
jgi:hypothetical protein